MRREVGAAAVERELPPAAAEGGNAAVAVLQAAQPARTGQGRPRRIRIRVLEEREREQRTRGVVGVRDTAVEVGPGPPARGRAGVRMDAAVLLVEEGIRMPAPVSG